MPSFLSKKMGFGQPKPEQSHSRPRTTADTAPPRPVRTNYTSIDVEIPPKFLKHPAPDQWNPITLKRIDFAAEGLPYYADASAWILENVLSASECAELLALAESSAQAGEGGDKWRPAMVNVGGNFEVLATGYRSSDRIVWDQAEVMGRIMDRCFEAEGLREQLCEVIGSASCLGPRAATVNEKWVFTRPNERMRFLRYRKGQFFQRESNQHSSVIFNDMQADDGFSIGHCDGSYESNKPEQKFYERSLFTLHLYLGGDQGLKGGSTAFFGMNPSEGVKKIDVEAKQGRGLIFQHRQLMHSGEEVEDGEKFTMRTDLMFKHVDLVQD